MRILAIETSCDDTGVAVLDASKTGSFSVLSNIIASQIEVHKQYGGVYPFAAKREHIKNLPVAYEQALKEAKIKPKDIDLIAVTQGPGLEPCLWVGVNFAKGLAEKLSVPLIPVNHIEGHILVNYLEEKDIKLPAIALIVSGGHTQLVLIKKIGEYQILGETRDDAAGECFDKCAKILGLGYPGGPEIAKLAEKTDRLPMSIQLPRPMIHTKDYDFSFSGLKTAVLYAWRKIGPTTKISDRTSLQLVKIGFAKEVQQAIIDVLLKKTMKAVKNCGSKTLILGGGVSANSELRRQFEQAVIQTPGVCIKYPEADLSTDNGVMIAVAGWFNRNKKIAWQNLSADANLRIGCSD